jgi:hypothetical protein
MNLRLSRCPIAQEKVLRPPSPAHSSLPAEGRRELEQAVHWVEAVQDEARAKSLEGSMADWKAQMALLSHLRSRAAHPQFRRHKRLVRHLQCPTPRPV